MLTVKRIEAVIIAIFVSLIMVVQCSYAVIGQPTPPPELSYKPDEIIVKFHKPLADALEAQLAEGKAVTDLKLTATLDNLNRKYEVTSIEPLIKNFKQKRQRIENLLKKDPLLLMPSERHLVRRLNRSPKNAKVPELGRMYRLKFERIFEDGLSVKEVVDAYNVDPNVEYAELNYVVSICTEPNDSNYPVQWALANTGQMYPWDGRFREPPGIPDCDIDANEAWDITTGSSDVVVAVLDTGVDYNHRDLQNNMWTDENGRYGYDFVHDDNDPMDDYGHGTHCTGIISADSNNGLDIAGVSWSAKIMALKFLNRVGTGYISDAIPAFAYATDNGADIVSNSWRHGIYPINAIQEAIDYAYSQGVIIVAAAGNENTNVHTYPAAYDHVIAVGATDSNDNKASFSNYGDWVDLAAPGVDILSLRAHNTDLYGDGKHFYPYGNPNATMYICSGTSMACPHVAGACALLLSVNSYMSPDDANNILMDAVDVVFEPNDHICASNGRLNVHKALLAAVPSKGYVSLDRDYYNCNCNVGISLADRDLKGHGTQNVNITCSSDLETVTLTEAEPNTGVFTGTISTASGDPNAGDSILQVSHDETITVTYEDANDGTGSPASANDAATVDCVVPNIISGINIEVLGQDVTVTFETDEYTLGQVLYGLSCGGPYNSDVNFGTNHNIKLTEISPWSDYYFIVEATDRAGNKVVDNNDGNCYRFSTDGPNDFNVPGDFNSIQEAINYSWDGGTVTVAPGTYNEKINFKGRAITVKSTAPNDWSVVVSTIIVPDSNGPQWWLPTVTFENEEDAQSVLTGFTVKNYGVSQVFSAGIRCNNWSSPTISRCIIEAEKYGINIGSLFQFIGWLPTIINNKIRSSEIGILLQGSVKGTNGKIENNWIYDNVDGIVVAGGNAQTVRIKSNWIYGNKNGIKFTGYVTNGKASNNTIVDNSITGVLVYQDCEGSVYNCILWGNADDLNNCNATYSCIEDPNDASGVGNITDDPCFVNADANDFHLGAHSPCINTGDPNYQTEEGEMDIDGDRRKMGMRVDMGADEADCLIGGNAHTNEHADWVAWGKLDCWCYARECRGDINGLKIGPYWVQSLDLQLLNAAYNKTDSQLPPGGICADLNHTKTGPYRVQLLDLNILNEYFNKPEAQVPVCDQEPITTGPYNYFTFPP